MRKGKTKNKKHLLIDKTITGNIIGRKIPRKYFPKEMDVFCYNLFCVLSELRVQLSGVLLWEFRCWCPKAHVGSSGRCSHSPGSAEPSQISVEGGNNLRFQSIEEHNWQEMLWNCCLGNKKDIVKKWQSNMGFLLFCSLSEVRVGPWPGQLHRPSWQSSWQQLQLQQGLTMPQLHCGEKKIKKRKEKKKKSIMRGQNILCLIMLQKSSSNKMLPPKSWWRAARAWRSALVYSTSQPLPGTYIWQIKVSKVSLKGFQHH